MTTPLANTARSLAEKWELEQLKLEIATPYGEVYFAIRHNLPVALKVTDPKMNEPDGPEAMLHFAGIGAARLLVKSEKGFLMERIEPGRQLSNMVFDGKDDEATEIVCQVAAELHKSGPSESFGSIPTWHERYDIHAEHEGAVRLPTKIYHRAKGLYQEMALSQGPKTVLHGDLHHDNIIFDHLRGWLAIDAKGYLGEREFEYGCALRNPGTDPRLFARPEIIERRMSIIIEHTGLDRQRILIWAFTQAVLSAIWSMEDGLDLTRGITTAKTIDALL